MIGPAGETTLVPTVDDQRRFWNAWDSDFRENRPLDEMSQRRGAMVLGWVGSLELRSARILEVGCANGWLSEKLAAFGSVTAIDLADEVIARAKLRCPHIDFRAGDMMTTDLEEGAFDLVVSLETLSHIVDQAAFVGELSRSVCVGGYLLITTQNRFVFERLDGVAPKAPGLIRKWSTKRELENLLRPHFRVRRITTIAPAGRRGVLRFINSLTVGAAADILRSRSWIEHLKERAGLGQTIVVLAQKNM